MIIKGDGLSASTLLGEDYKRVGISNIVKCGKTDRGMRWETKGAKGSVSHYNAISGAFSLSHHQKNDSVSTKEAMVCPGRNKKGQVSLDIGQGLALCFFRWNVALGGEALA